MGVTQLAFQFGTDLLGLILNPITENSEGFKEAISNTLAPLENILGTLANSFTRVWEEINQMYEAHISPLFSSLSNGISEIIETLLKGYNEHVAPVLDSLSGKFADVWQGTIEPLLSNFIGLLGDVAEFSKNCLGKYTSTSNKLDSGKYYAGSCSGTRRFRNKVFKYI